MPMSNYTTELLNLEGIIITNVDNIADQLHINIELPRAKHICPACGAVTDRIHDYRMQIIKDIPLARDTFLHLRKRRYRCSCGKRFFETNTFLPRYYRVTSRLVAQIIQEFRKIVPATEIGSRFNVSAVTSMCYFNCFNQRAKVLPEVLSLDEFKMDVPRSNGYIEGCNNKTKVLKRVCFGMRNFNNFRKRILLCNT